MDYLIHVEYQGKPRWGFLHEEHVLLFKQTFSNTRDIVEFFNEHQVDFDAFERCHLADTILLSPVTRDRQFICQGANYRKHMLESGMNPDAKTFNMIFTKASSCIVSANSDVYMPQSKTLLDYEIELGVVLRRDILKETLITEKNLQDYVFGMTIVNDYSARDIQIPQMQFYKGKSYRSFGPVGPVIALLDKNTIHQLRNMELTLKVNGEVRQQDSTQNLVYGVAETLSELSAVQDLYAGDLLATGTPAGCALRIPSPTKQKVAALIPEQKKWELFLKSQAKRKDYLKPGDIVEASIVSLDKSINLGKQTNCVYLTEN